MTEPQGAGGHAAVTSPPKAGKNGNPLLTGAGSIKYNTRKPTTARRPWAGGRRKEWSIS